MVPGAQHADVRSYCVVRKACMAGLAKVDALGVGGVVLRAAVFLLTLLFLSTVFEN